MLKLNDLNNIVGMGWDRGNDTKVRFSFIDDAGNYSCHISVNPWSQYINLQNIPISVESFYTFTLGDLRRLVQKLKIGYANVNVILPLQFDRDGFAVKGGPGNGTRVETIGAY